MVWFLLAVQPSQDPSLSLSLHVYLSPHLLCIGLLCNERHDCPDSILHPRYARSLMASLCLPLWLGLVLVRVVSSNSLCFPAFRPFCTRPRHRIVRSPLSYTFPLPEVFVEHVPRPTLPLCTICTICTRLGEPSSNVTPPSPFQPMLHVCPPSNASGLVVTPETFPLFSASISPYEEIDLIAFPPHPSIQYREFTITSSVFDPCRHLRIEPLFIPVLCLCAHTPFYSAYQSSVPHLSTHPPNQSDGLRST
jgi:hypothetical protein